MSFSFNTYSIHPSGSTSHVFSRFTIKYIGHSIRGINDVSDLRNLKNDIHEKVLSTFPERILKKTYLPIVQNNNSGSLILKQHSFINWDDPDSNSEGNALGEDELKKMFSFENDFFELIEKENLCKDDLLIFESTYPQFQNWNLFGSSFLSHPFLVSRLSGFRDTNREQVLSALYVAQLVLLRYRRLITGIMSIRKAMMYGMGGIFYRRFAVSSVCAFRIQREIHALSNRTREGLPIHWWRDMEKFHLPSLNDPSPLEEGYQDELNNLLKPPSPHSYNDSSFEDIEDN